jgi:hypothetical protein
MEKRRVASMSYVYLRQGDRLPAVGVLQKLLSGFTGSGV